MNKKISALGVAIVVVTCVAAKYAAASSPSVFVPLGIGMDRTTEEVARTMRDVHARVGIDKFVLHAPGHGVRITGAYDEAGYQGVGRRVKAIQDAVSDAGIKVGFLMGPTMNVGINHPWTKFVPANGVTRQFTAGIKGLVCIASRGKVKNFAWKRSLSENGDSADVFGRAFEGFRGASSPDGGWGNAPVLLLI